MGIEVGDKKVKKIMVGEKVIYRDSDGWIPLKLPDSAMDGLVLFRDNGNGTASIAGAAHYKLPAYGESPAIMLLPPDGYEFSSIPWDQGNVIKGIAAYYGQTGNSNGTGRELTTSIDSGNVLAKAGLNAEVNNVTVFFTQNTSQHDAKDAMPALLGIIKV